MDYPNVSNKWNLSNISYFRTNSLRDGVLGLRDQLGMRLCSKKTHSEPPRRPQLTTTTLVRWGSAPQVSSQSYRCDSIIIQLVVFVSIMFSTARSVSFCKWHVYEALGDCMSVSPPVYRSNQSLSRVSERCTGNAGTYSSLAGVAIVLVKY